MNQVLLLFALAAVVLVAVSLADRVRVFQKLGAAATSILFALVLSNVGLLPGQSPVYDFLMGRGVLAGIVLVLLSVNLRSIRDAGAPMLLAFAIGAAGSAVGATVMATLLRSLLGTETWKLSGQFAATYIGGGMNFAAVGQELGTRSDLFAAGIAADVIVTAVWLVACLTIPEFFSGRVAARDLPPTATSGPRDGEQPGLDRLLGSSGTPMTLVDFAGLAAVTFGTMAASDTLADWVPVVPRVLWLTTLALVLAQVPPVRRLTGGVVMGNFLLLLFLASNGAKSVIALIVEIGPAVFYFAAGTVAIHGIILFGIGLALRMNADLLSIASQANVGGSTMAMALAGSRRRLDLILPGVIVGMLGNALGNYAGIAVAHVARSVVG
ncbi:MAG: DUF819 family protein [Acidobacteriota bacterium]|nr:DUF819 family protein [Acidobacteriota bacterium]